MTEPQHDQKIQTSADTGAHAAKPGPDRPVYMYASAGINERKGGVPFWLWLVAVSLLIWGIYYLITYWNAPAVPTT